MFGLEPHTIRKRLTEPDYARARYAPTPAMRRKLRQRNSAIRPVRPALQTAKPPDVPMQFENSAAAGAVVQAVHVLRNQSKIALLALELDQGEMPAIGRRLRDQPAPPVIPFPHQTGVASECLRRSQFLRLMFLPEALIASKRGYAAL